MKLVLSSALFTLLMCLGGCASTPATYQTDTGSVPKWENPLGVTDPALRQWYDMPYYNPYLQ